MTFEDIQNRISEIKAEADDPESAHGKEDLLYYDFIKHIAETGSDEQIKCAKKILETVKIGFPRWYA